MSGEKEISVDQLLTNQGMNPATGTAPDPPGATIPVAQLLSDYGINPNPRTGYNQPQP
jgi:hypothetical protein